MICENCNRKLSGRQEKYCSDKCRKAAIRGQHRGQTDNERGHERGQTQVVERGHERGQAPYLNRNATINLRRADRVLFVWREGVDNSAIHEDITPASMDRLMRLINDTPPAYGWIGGEVVWKLSRTNRQTSFDISSGVLLAPVT